MYTPSPSPKKPPEKRQACQGWTRAVSRRNADFLLSVESGQLTGHGYALSLTVRDCPPAATDWNKARRRFLERLRSIGMTRLHWLTEWQRRGCPHLHAAVWFPSRIAPHLIAKHWTQAAAEFGPRLAAQHVAPITGAAGWFEYLAKHAARGVAHYQRSAASIPAGWKNKTGRMWGHAGEWPTTESKSVDVPPRVWSQYRRLMIRYQLGKARRQHDKARFLYLRRYRAQAPEETSRTQALPRLWIPEDDQWQLLRCAFDSHQVQHSAESAAPKHEKRA